MESHLNEILATLGAHTAGAAVVALAVALLCRAVRHASVVHVLWVVVLLKLVTPPFFELAVLPAPEEAVTTTATIAPFEASPRPFASWRAPVRAELPASSAAAVAGAQAPSKTASVPAELSAGRSWELAGRPLWGAAVLAVLSSGTVLVLGLAVFRLRRFRRLLGSTEEAPPALRGRVEELAGSLGLRRVPRIRVARGRVSPMVWPRLGGAELLVPAALLERLAGAELDAVLVHELAHLRRRDHWVRCLELLATALFWWNPVLWWARRNLRRAEERSCDVWVAHVLPGRARDYAEGLLKTLELLAGGATPLPATGTGMDVRHDIKERLTMILTDKTPKILAPWHRWLLAAAAAAVLVVIPTQAERAAGNDGEDEITAEEARYRTEELALERRELALHGELRSIERERGRLHFERGLRQHELEIAGLEDEAARLDAAGETAEAELRRQESAWLAKEAELMRREYALEEHRLEEIEPVERELREARLRMEELEIQGRQEEAEALQKELGGEKMHLHELHAAHEAQRIALEQSRITQQLEILDERQQTMRDAGHTLEAEQLARQAQMLRIKGEMASLHEHRSAERAALERRVHELRDKARALHGEGREEMQAERMVLKALEAKARMEEREMRRKHAELERRAEVGRLRAHAAELDARRAATASEKERMEAELRLLKEELVRLEKEGGSSEE